MTQCELDSASGFVYIVNYTGNRTRLKKMENTKKILKDPRTYYVIALLGIFFFPPLMDTYANQDTFKGWHFVSTLAMKDDWQIHIAYMIVEFFIVSVIYFIYRKKG